MKDYYQILGITKSATEEDIKKAFRTLAHKFHPDKKGGDEAKFKEASEAYALLSDKKSVPSTTPTAACLARVAQEVLVGLEAQRVSTFHNFKMPFRRAGLTWATSSVIFLAA